MERAIPWAVFTVLMTAACFWRPRAMRVVVGVFFVLMGLGVHGAFILSKPEGYIDFARQALIPFYAELAEAVVVGLTPVVFGALMLVFEVALAVLMLGRERQTRIGFVLGALFLIAITPLGVEVLPNAVLAIGLWRLSREEFPATAIAGLRDWRSARRQNRESTARGQETRS